MDFHLKNFVKFEYKNTKKTNAMDIEQLKSQIFEIKTHHDFNTIALQIFRYQYQHNVTYRTFIDLLPVNINDIISCYDIPCIPVEFFKSHDILCKNSQPELIFKSSGTSSGQKSRSLVFSKTLYETSILQCFSGFYGNPEEYIILALTPDYKTTPDSSLAFMLDFLIKKSGNPESGFYMNRHDKLIRVLEKKPENKKILFGITYTLMDFAEHHKLNLANTIIVETGGMKGKRQELTRSEFHAFLSVKFGLNIIHSEYSMCELMSQAYSKGGGLFLTPSWMKIYIREFNDPFSRAQNEKNGGINIIDLANLYTCSFISTKDIGILHDDETFEVLGRFDYSDIRGCNLLT